MNNDGLYEKYIIQKADGTEIDKNADYFVLRLDTDKYAREAILFYAMLIERENHELAYDLMMKYGTKISKNEGGVEMTEINKVDGRQDPKSNIRNKILSTEYDFNFDMYRQNRMIVSYYKYGDIKTNYGDKLVNAITNLEIRLKKYKDTGNKEYLLDIANFAMIEFMYPQHPNAHFSPNDSNDKIEGIPINDIKNISN